MTGGRTTPEPPDARAGDGGGIWHPRYVWVSVGAVAMIFLAATQALAVTTVMPSSRPTSAARRSTPSRSRARSRRASSARSRSVPGATVATRCCRSRRQWRSSSRVFSSPGSRRRWRCSCSGGCCRGSAPAGRRSRSTSSCAGVSAVPARPRVRRVLGGLGDPLDRGALPRRLRRRAAALALGLPRCGDPHPRGVHRRVPASSRTAPARRRPLASFPAVFLIAAALAALAVVPGLRMGGVRPDQTSARPSRQ